MVNRIINSLIAVSILGFSLLSHSAEVAKTIRTEKHVTASQNKVMRELKRGSGVDQKDVIKTGSQARASFRFSEGTLLTLGADTEMLVTEFQHSDKQKSAAFQFSSGAFRIITGLITKTNNPHFTVQTPMGTIGVRGTDFWGGNLSDDKSIDVILLDSEHPLTLENEFGKVTITKAGYGTTLLPGKAPIKPIKWTDEKLGRAVKTISFPEP